jgi:cell division septum initiation protein DivIVA
MKKFRISLFGYCKKQVNAYVLSLRKDYEKELSKGKDRLWEVNAENRELKAKLLEYQERLSKYGEQELYISKALVKAEESAQAILRESYQKIEI